MGDLTEAEEKKMMAGKCPDCGNHIFLHGPCGGMAENIRCFECGSEFNFCPPMSTDRLDRNEPAFYHGAFDLRQDLMRADALLIEYVPWYKRLWQRIFHL